MVQVKNVGLNEGYGDGVLWLHGKLVLVCYSRPCASLRAAGDKISLLSEPTRKGDEYNVLPHL